MTVSSMRENKPHRHNSLMAELKRPVPDAQYRTSGANRGLRPSLRFCLPVSSDSRGALTPSCAQL